LGWQTPSEGRFAVPLAASGSGGNLLPFGFIILLFGAMYFLFIRPQQRRNRETQAMQSTLGPGDEVMTGSGVYGTVVEIDDENGVISLEVSPDVVMRFARGAVARVVNQVPREIEEEEEDVDEEPDYDTDETEEAGEAGHQVIERKD
jgi:preprotein translocase subunit YajC